jgi:Xaa-Pro aminopeptidase
VSGRTRTKDAGTLARLERLRAELRARELDSLLVESAVDLRYLLGFTADQGDGLAVLGADGAVLFLTDFRYQEQAAEQVPAEVETRIVRGELIDSLAESLVGEVGRLGFDDTELTVARHARLGELLEGRAELVAATGLIRALRVVKDPGEVERIRAAAVLADEALSAILGDGLVGRTERDVAIELEVRMRRLGAEAPSFPPIVAAGAHGALPHAEPRDVEIAPDHLVVIDWGAKLDGYCSDCTRTYATGDRVSYDAREVYEIVRSAQAKALAAVRPGPNGRDLDAVARKAIDDAGYGERFGHGLGHGVGLEIHEPPRLSWRAPEDPLRAGSVVTIEPGIYLPGRLGVRIEDLVVIADDGPEILTHLSKEFTVVD